MNGVKPPSFSLSRFLPDRAPEDWQSTYKPPAFGLSTTYISTNALAGDKTKQQNSRENKQAQVLSTLHKKKHSRQEKKKNNNQRGKT